MEVIKGSGKDMEMRRRFKKRYCEIKSCYAVLAYEQLVLLCTLRQIAAVYDGTGVPSGVGAGLLVNMDGSPPGRNFRAVI